MPTGYTAIMQRDCTFEDFVWSCARGMGALIMMRDEPSDAPIPERFEPSDYHTRKISEAKAELLSLQNMTQKKLSESAQAAFDAELKERGSSIRKNDELRRKYLTMDSRIKAWIPPTADHEDFKAFMLEVISTSIKFDCDNSYFEDRIPALLSGTDWWVERVANANKDLEYHTAEYKKETERTEVRNKWLSALRESLAAIS